MDTDSGASFATLTHARLRAAQGDVPGAVRILRVILEVQPGHHAARGFLAEIGNQCAVAHTEPSEVAADAVTPAKAGDLALRFRDALDLRRQTPRVRRLSLWLERTQRNRGARYVR